MLQNSQKDKNVSRRLESSTKSDKTRIELPRVKVATYDENEETTLVDLAILLNENCFKSWVIVPIISLLTIGLFAVYLYWNKSLQRDWLYTRATSLATATHIYIESRGKFNSSVLLSSIFLTLISCSDGNKEIVKVYDRSRQSD